MPSETGVAAFTSMGRGVESADLVAQLAIRVVAAALLEPLAEMWFRGLVGGSRRCR